MLNRCLYHYVYSRVYAGVAYKTLDPGPYCPDMGQAHITCKAFSVPDVLKGKADVAESRVMFLVTRVSSKVEESAGMTSRGELYLRG